MIMCVLGLSWFVFGMRLSLLVFCLVVALICVPTHGHQNIPAVNFQNVLASGNQQQNNVPPQQMVRHPDGAPAQGVLPSSNNDAPAQQPLHNPPISQQQAPPPQPPMANQRVPPHQPPQMHPGMNQQAPPLQPPMANQQVPPQQPPQMHPGMNQQAPPPQPPMANQLMPPQQPPQMHPGMNQQAPPPQPPIANQQVPPQQPPQMHPGMNQQAPPPQPPMANQQVPPQQPPQMHPGVNQQAPPPQPPMANQQVPPQQPPQMHPGMNQQARPQEMLPNQPPVVKQPPPHLHQPPPPSHQIHSPDSLPPKPRQMQFQPPAVVHNDAELDFYSRLPSPKVFESDSGGILDNPRHFIALTVNVTPAAKDCYFYEAVAGFDVDFQVLGGDGMDIGLAVFDPSGVSVALRDPFSHISKEALTLSALTIGKLAMDAKKFSLPLICVSIGIIPVRLSRN
uniref:Cohesin domain-containing protein n=1 Tax=Mesocestoides corti TaxID=53468 RepID=A0A5K3EH60_MESCO